ncbi:MAG TPA: tripartite tricarboxylate transporter substrate binding protein [Burkholderiales bacterium]|nr:tripartite tricarboxylate transporter substrate binding protein [Burkholderiales bacterium]
MSFPALKSGCLLAAALGASLAAQDVAAQAYPSRPVRVIVPFSPGGAADVPGRIMANEMSRALGQQVIVDNRPGAGSTIGTEVAAKSPPDGYTLLLISNTHAINASLYKKLPYHPVNDFAPVLQFMTSPNVLVVHPSLPVRTVKELVALAKAKPGQIDYVSSGNGSSQHLFTALFTSLAGIKMNHVPYKGSAQARADLIAGHIPVGVPGIASVINDVKGGRLRALAVTGGKRARQLPEVPTLAEAGVKGYVADQWFGFLAPAGTPQEVIAKLNAETQKVLNDAALQEKIRALGAEPDYLPPEKFGALIKTELVKWGRVVKEVGLRIE